MTHIFTGEGLGLNGSSIGLGSYGPKGSAALGQGGESVYVNAANGNLVLRQADGFLADIGFGIDLFQTYNSLGEGGSSWRFNVQSRLTFNGAANTAGSSVTRIDEDGHQTHFIYDVKKQVYLPQDGSKSRLAFEQNGWNYSEGNQKTSSHYNNQGQLTDIHDLDGHNMHFSYTKGQLAQIIDGSGKQQINWSFTNGLLSDVTTISEGKIIHHLHYEYDQQQRLHKVSRDLGDGKLFWITYDYVGDSNRISDIKQSDGTNLHIDYDGEGRVKQLIDGEGRVTQYRYEQGHTRITNSLGEVWTYYYDERNRLTGIDGPEQYCIRYFYDGNYLSSIVQDKQVWLFRYNDDGDCIETTEPTGLITKRVYDARHNVLLETQYLPFDGANHPGQPQTTRYIYDERGHLLFSIKADGTVTECRYDEQGLLTSTRCYLLAAYDIQSLAVDVLLSKEQLQAWVLTQNPKDVSLTEYRYDWRGQRTDELHYKQVTELGVGLLIDALHTRYRYDAAGRLIEKSTPLHGDWSITQFIYDDLGRLIQTIDNQNNSQKIEYDDLHQRIIQTDANGLQTIRIYDHSGLLLSVMRLDSAHDFGTTSYQYDSAGRLVAETGVDGLSRYNFYDMQGRLIAKVEGNGQVTEYRYAGNGLLLSTHEYQNKISTGNWQKSLPSFAEIKLQSGMQDRISQIIYNQYNQIAYRIDAQGAVIGYEYDEFGRLVSSTAFANRITNYDPNQLLIVDDINLTVDALHDRRINYYYDSEGRLKAEVNAEGFAKEYKYDRLGNLIELCRYFNAVTAHTGSWMHDCPERSNKDIHNFVLYDGRNLKIAEIDGEGYLIEYRYNEAGLLVEQCAYERAIARPIEINEATDLNQIRPKSQTNDHYTYYSYDSLGRLIQEKKYNGLVTNYSYDEMGRLSSTSLIDAKTQAMRQQQYRYDAMGRIIQSLDELGCALLNQSSIDADAIELIWQQHSISFTYNKAGLLASKTNSLQQSTRYFYDEQALLRYTINADGAVVENSYNSFNQIASIKKYSSFVRAINKDTTTDEITKKLDLLKDERFDEVIRYEYNTLGQLIAQYQGSKGLISTQYNAFGELEQTSQRVNAQQNKITEYHYDRRGLLIRSINDPANIKQIAASEYDAFGYLNASLDHKMNKTRYTLNKRGEQVRILRPDNLFKRVTYDAFGRIIIETDFNAKDIKQYIFDDQNQKLTLINPQTNSQIVTEFNAFGDTIAIVNANGFKTEHFYNEQGQLIRVNSPEGAFKEYHYDGLGRLCFELDGSGHKISYTYDASGHVLSKTQDPDGLKLTTTYQYDALGRQLQVKDANGCIKQFIYDEGGRLILSCTDPQGLNLVTHFDYDDRGLLVKQTELNAQGLNKIIAYEWDNLGRKTAVLVDPDGLRLRTGYQYDVNNNLTAQTDANGHTTHYIYDLNNRCHYQINALGQVTEHVYDKNGNEIQTTCYAKPINSLSQYDEQSVKAMLISDKSDQYQFRAFNGDNALTQIYDGLGYLTLYDYDAIGNVIKKTQYNQAVSIESLKQGARERPLDKSTRVEHYVYDGLNRLRFQCDQFGRITETVYDKSGQLIEKTRYSQLIDFSNRDASFTLEGISATLNRTSGQDQSTRYAYDAAHNLIMEVSAQGVVKTYAYDALGHLISNTIYATAITSSDTPLKLPASTANDRTNHYVYDAAGREVYRISAEGRVLERRYDAVGNVIQELTHASLIQTTSYTQDAVHNALANLNGGARTTGYEYNAAGRLLTQRNAQRHATHYSYDAQGNVTSKTEANHAVWTYKYDALNQLIETISPSVTIAGMNNRAIITRNVYDCFGNVTTLIRDAEGIKQTVCYEYDAVNQKIKTLYPNSKVSNASSCASNQRQENTLTVTEELRYNAFGQVIASSDKAKNWKYFAYNERGLLAYSIDAQSAVTHYDYDVFDRLTTKTIHASLINLNQDSQYSETDIKKALSRNSNDRHEYYEYTLDNYLVATSKDPVSMYNSKTRHYEPLKPVTRNLYNNFGELIKSSVKVNENEWVNTHHYYNRDGKQIALIDAAGYLTAYALNAYGEMETTTEFSTALSEWDTEHYKPPIASQKDRISVLAYDALGQITSKTLKQVSFQRKSSDGQYLTVSEDLVTRYQYDALGHLVATTDVKGNTAYCYYNELGQLIAKVAPQTQVGRAATTYSYDAVGNLLETRQWAKGVALADATHFVLNGASDTYDIVKKQEYNTHGLLIAQSDGVNHKTYYSYDANGNLARSWSEFSQIGTTSKILQDKRYSYDKANRLLQTATFKTNGSSKTEDVTYNAFGEVTAKGINGHFTTHVDYDVLGRVWRSNTSGHYEIYVYDLMDRVTQIVTATNGFSKLYGERVDLSSNLFESTLFYDKDNLLFDVQRQNNIYDALGHLISQSKEFTKTAEVSQGERLEYINQSQEVDRWGNMLRFTNPQGYQTYYEYNAFNEVVRQELPEIKAVDEHGVARYIRPVNSYAYNELG